jgi:hypothetical protein
MLFDQVVKPYKPYVTVDYGVIPVSVDDIIGLSLPVSKIRNGEKLKELRQSIKQKGWKNDCPEELHLYRLPDGKYTVASAGNHRIFLSNQMDMSKIKARVTLLIPENYIPENMKAKIVDYEDKEKTYRLEAEKLHESLQNLDIKRKNAKEEFAFKNFSKLSDDMYNRRQHTLLGLARFLNLLPDEAAE